MWWVGWALVHLLVSVPCFLVGEFVSDVLLVPEKCRFFHKERMDVCESHQHWHTAAKEVTDAVARMLTPDTCTWMAVELGHNGVHLRGPSFPCCRLRPEAQSNGKVPKSAQVTPKSCVAAQVIFQSCKAVLSSFPRSYAGMELGIEVISLGYITLTGGSSFHCVGSHSGQSLGFFMHIFH